MVLGSSNNAQILTILAECSFTQPPWSYLLFADSNDVFCVDFWRPFSRGDKWHKPLQLEKQGLAQKTWELAPAFPEGFTSHLSDPGNAFVVLWPLSLKGLQSLAKAALKGYSPCHIHDQFVAQLFFSCSLLLKCSTRHLAAPEVLFILGFFFMAWLTINWSVWPTHRCEATTCLSCRMWKAATTLAALSCTTASTSSLRKKTKQLRFPPRKQHFLLCGAT